MRRPRALKLNTKLIVDAVIANAIVRIAPAYVNKMLPLPESVQSFSGVGAAYLFGMLAKKPNVANIGIATGLVDIAMPFIEGTGMVVAPSNQIPNNVKSGAVVKAAPPSSVGDYFRLSGYTNDPYFGMGYNSYHNFYN